MVSWESSVWRAIPRGEMAWLLTFGLPPEATRYLAVLASADWAVGLGVIGVGLLVAGRHLVRIGLVAFAPSVVLRMMLIPGYIAIAAGRMVSEFPAPGARAGQHGVVRPDTPWPGIAALAGAAINIAYFLFVWRELRRMGPGRGCVTRTDSHPSPTEG
jgi:hypothetical protein